MACKAIPSTDHAQFCVAFIDSMAQYHFVALKCSETFFTQILKYETHAINVSPPVGQCIASGLIKKIKCRSCMPHDDIAFVGFVYQSAPQRTTA